MQKVLLAILMLFASLDLEASLHLRSLLPKAEEGDFVVSYQNKSYTLLHAYLRQGNHLELEELTVPANFKEKEMSWQTWMEAGAPGHTSRVMYRVDLDTGHILTYYSFTKNAWLAVDPAENLLSQLLSLSLEEVPKAKRRRRGPRLTDGRDTRPVWEPPLFVNGKRQSGAHFTAWKGRWPKDGSELSNKELLVYLPSSNTPHLQGFPYWLEISGGVGRAHFRVVDSGKGLYSPLPAPRRDLL